MYPAIKIPFEFTPFSVMSKFEANEYFDWFISIIPQRLEILREYIEFTGSSESIQLDLSPESLISLWEWFIPRIEQRNLTEEELNEELELVPDWIKSEVEETVIKFSRNTENLVVDIGIYFGSVMLHSSDQLKWTVIYKPTNHVDVNQPVLTGKGRMVLNPIRIVDVCAARTLSSGANINLLNDLYVSWRDSLLN